MLCAACYHAAGLLLPVNESPLWRHALFVGIDLACAVGFLYRPSWFLLLFAGLTVQQCAGHGAAFFRNLEEEGKVQWLDAAVVIFMLAALACLVLDARRKEKKR